jgi:hypothetical protein
MAWLTEIHHQQSHIERPHTHPNYKVIKSLVTHKSNPIPSMGALWRSRFLSSIISDNDRVKHVDSSQTVVNLGHHLENLANNH